MQQTSEEQRKKEEQKKSNKQNKDKDKLILLEKNNEEMKNQIIDKDNKISQLNKEVLRYMSTVKDKETKNKALLEESKKAIKEKET